jgi:hypothetical protein
MLVMGTESGDHPDESQLENYSLGRIPEPEAARLEEHLLLCDACRQCLEASDVYVRSMRRASLRMRAEHEKVPRAWGLPRLVPALAAVIVALGIGFAWRMNQKGTLTPVAVILEATRGGGFLAQVPAGKPLLLKPGLDGLPSFPEYHLEMVDRAGKRVWQGNFTPLTGAAAHEQPPGLYFVRLYSLPGALLREYAMEVKPGP